MASFTETTLKDGSLSIKVYWSLPKRLVPPGQAKATGSLRVHTRKDCMRAIQIAESHKHAITGEDVSKIIRDENAAALASSQVMTLRKWYEIWISSLPVNGPSERQVETYRAQFELDDPATGKIGILKVLGDRPLTDLEQLDITQFFAELRTKNNIKTSTLKRYHAALRSCLYAATRSPKASGISANPAVGIKFEVSSQEVEDRDPEKYFEEGQYELIRQSIHDDSKLFVRFLAETGIRFSEATALTVRDMKWHDNVAEIDEAHKRTYSGRMIEKPGKPKGKSDRWVEVTPSVMNDVRVHVERLGLYGDDLVFRAPQGGRVHHSNFLARRWKPTLIRLNWCPEHMPTDKKMSSICRCLGDLQWVTYGPHALRHSWATWQFMIGTSINFISRQLGHPDTAFTERTYVHLLKSRPLGIGASLDRFLGRTV